MRYFLDTEFIESGPRKPIQLVSIGMVSGDNREYYAISNEFDPSSANQWVKDNVLVHLHGMPKSLLQISIELIDFLGTKPEIWGYYADYDWVVFCQIFGSMMHLPKSYPMYCRDIKQWCDSLGNPGLPKQEPTEHNALNDARWNREVWEFLSVYRQEQSKDEVKR
jgi:3' exoribonuclease, RNase T-like